MQVAVQQRLLVLNELGLRRGEQFVCGLNGVDGRGVGGQGVVAGVLACMQHSRYTARCMPWFVPLKCMQLQQLRAWNECRIHAVAAEGEGAP